MYYFVVIPEVVLGVNCITIFMLDLGWRNIN